MKKDWGLETVRDGRCYLMLYFLIWLFSIFFLWGWGWAIFLSLLFHLWATGRLLRANPFVEFVHTAILQLFCNFLSLFFRTSLPLWRQAMGSSSLQGLPFLLNLSQTTYPPLGSSSTLFPPRIVSSRDWWGKWHNCSRKVLWSSQQLLSHFKCSLFHVL